MKLPHYEEAVVAEAKIVQYLLNEYHPKGKDKAAFFTRFGFEKTDWVRLADALRKHAATYDIADTMTTSESIHYTIEGQLESPDKRNPLIRSVWAIDSDSDTPRFITAYPLKPKREGEP
jgi:hypothetical protein